MMIFEGLAAVAVAILLLAGIVLGFGHWRFGRKVAGEVRDLFAESPLGGEVIVTPAMLEKLPASIQRYLTHAGVVGKPIVHAVRLKQSGRFRTGPDQPWMKLRADEYYTVDQPGFIWDATFYQAGVPILRVRDSYRNGHGGIMGKLAGLIPVVTGSGAGIDQGTMLRYLQEMAWFPSAFLRDNITFAPIDDGSAQVTLTDHGRSVSGVMSIDAQGQLTNFSGWRFRSDEAGYGTWTTPMTRWGELAGLQLPLAGKGVWLLPEGDFEYVDVTAEEIQYDVPAPY